jgi:uncharacterized protein YuzE
MQMECDVEYAGMVLGFEIEAASSAVRLTHDEMDQIHRHHHRRHPSCPSR